MPYLFDEAVKAYVFGAFGASLAMCRAITEIVLTKHYGVVGSDLKDVIVLAEKRFPLIRCHKLQDKRRTANRVLHEGRMAEQQAVLGYLQTLRDLIERAPANT